MVKNHRDANEVPQKRNIRWTLIVLVLFFLGLLVDYMFLHLFFKEKNFSNGGLLQPIPTPPSVTDVTDTQTASGGDSSAEAKTNSKTAKTPETLAKFQAMIANCFGSESDFIQSTSTDQFIEKVLATNPSIRSSLEVENTHLRLKDGTIRRMHLILADPSSGKNVKELRYFSLDKEGLPVLIPLPDEKRLNPSAEYLESLKSEGTVVFHQLKEKRTLKDGSELSLNIMNDHVFEFQLFGKEKTFSCRELDCQCK